jgi:hypothetical protein
MSGPAGCVGAESFGLVDRRADCFDDAAARHRICPLILEAHARAVNCIAGGERWRTVLGQV